MSLEQLLQWDPDVLIVGGTTRSVAEVQGDPAWQNLRAVRDGRMYLNPKGVFPWDRYGPEEALQIQWAASILHAELFHDLDVAAETKQFYRAFLEYDQDDEDVRSILNPEA